MKILITGSFKDYSLEDMYLRALRDYPLEIHTFRSLDSFLERYQQSSVFEKAMYKLGSKAMFHRINKELLIKVELFKPEIVWVFRGLEIFPSTLKEIKSKGIKLVNLNPDHPFQYNRGTGNHLVQDSLPLYDLHFCYNKEVSAKISKELNSRTIILPFGYDRELLDNAEVLQFNEIQRACFIGTADRYRHNFIRELSRNGVPIDVYGPGWNGRLKGQSGLRCFGSVSGTDYYQTLRKYRLQLNLFRPYNRGSHNMRSFEIPAAGGVQLAPLSADHITHFEEHLEIFLYKNVTEASSLATTILNMPKEQIDEVRMAGKKRVLSGQNSYMDRAKVVFKEITSLRR